MTERQWLRGPGIASRARQKVRLSSGGTECAAWFYPGTIGGCVIMTGGFAVLAFDYRCFGESGGRPRQVARIRDQLADWQAALACAASRPGVDPAKLAIWSFSASGGHVFRVAASNPGLAAAIAQAPNADGPAAALAEAAVVESEHREPGVIEAAGEQVRARLLGHRETAGHDHAAAVGSGIEPGGALGAAAGKAHLLPGP